MSRHKTLFKTAILLLACALILGGCRKDNEFDNRSAEELYAEAKAYLEKNNWRGAVRAYRTLQTRYPFGRYAEQAQLEMAYAFYRASQPELALSTADRFIRMYPAHPNLDYAFYIRGLTNYDQRIGFLEKLMPDRVNDRDQSVALEAFRDFDQLTRRFPDSRYAPDARQRMVYLRNAMSAYELDVAEYYLRRKAYVAAANRARYLLETYPGSPEAGNALVVLNKAYNELDLPELADDALQVLEYNDPEHAYLTGEKEGGFFSKVWPFD
ncbi:outer membrane protein assembly factor BamD [Marinihelvus fidelis]|uniref:Outer membrane protein assembly factor BamD n=1 Tax=Marinihelvus fidelis TaxID=2613842 RepID=A0A5N0T528_9GAMM|nr:outer membrane protein assembly factor BamD [Marinihelvus fidelis]KAA9129888.1 outer membrane protein assembly factor BamD [Marinihelvus fidelis]